MNRSTAALPFLLGAAFGCVGPNPHFDGRPDASVPGGTDAGRDVRPSPPDGSGHDSAPGDVDSDIGVPLDGPAPEVGSDGAPSLVDAAVAPDRAPEAAEVVCGTGRADLTGVEKVDGIAIAADGTMYFSTTDGVDGLIGRILPGRAPQFAWARAPGARANWGLALDERTSQLYLASVSTGSIEAFDVRFAAPTARTAIGSLVEPNDVTMGPDGRLYFSNQGNGNIYWLDGNTRRPVNREPIGMAGGQAPSALAFGRDGALYVGLRSGGGITRLTLAGGSETGRSAYGSFDGWANGLAFDARGRLYVGTYSKTTASQLVLLNETGGDPQERLAGGQYAGMAFGRGALDCRDLYLADPEGPVRRLSTDTPGLLGP